jgi:transcriptional regulator
MYTPKLFSESDPAQLHEFIRSHAFGALVVASESGEVEIAHVPFVFDSEKGKHGELRVHLARANPIWKLAMEGRPLTIVFNGPHGYVSPRWYERPGEQVPTWNYTVVHVHGRARERLEGDALSRLLDELVAIYESEAAERAEPWSASRLDPSFRERLHREIVGLSIEVDRLEGKFKLSQNRSPADRDRVIRAFEERGFADDVAMARMMSELKARATKP